MSQVLQLPATLLPRAHRDFEGAIPRIDAAIRYQFRQYRWFAQQRDDALAEARAATWVTWQSLLRRGKEPQKVGIAAIVEFACRGVKNGRTVGDNRALGRGAGGLYHPWFHRTTGLRLIAFDDLANPHGQSWQDGFTTNDRHFGPADEAALRIDFAAWLATLPERKRRAVELLAEGLGTS